MSLRRPTSLSWPKAMSTVASSASTRSSSSVSAISSCIDKGDSKCSASDREAEPRTLYFVLGTWFGLRSWVLAEDQRPKAKGQKPKTQVLNTQLLSEPQLQTVHLAAVCFVVVAGEMKEAVQDELGNFRFKRQTVFFRLRRGGLN